MRLAVEHSWQVTPQEAREIQERLRTRWIGEDMPGAIETVGGLDAAFVLEGSQALRRTSSWQAMRAANRAITAAVVYRYPAMEEVERVTAVAPLTFPYVPGLLSFREIPGLLAALEKLRRLPDLLFCDGQGYAHPRRMGLATHLGILLNRPTIGCAKSLLIGRHGRLGEKAGSCAEIREGGEVIGAAVRTRDGVAPVYVSSGHQVSLESAIRLTLEVTDGTRIPKPTREADRAVREAKRKLLNRG
ncbi:MAG TPA: endonuclease V [Dongiaceae bacterium]|nr:endonuclease V [Dongiaceae bacterium]